MGRACDLTFAVGATLADLVQELNIDPAAIFIAWANGRDVTKRLGDNINLEYVLTDGDEIAPIGPDSCLVGDMARRLFNGSALMQRHINAKAIKHSPTQSLQQFLRTR